MIDIDLMEYGAFGDGKRNDTAIIQKAIDACSNSGGGMVSFTSGKVFLTGGIRVRDNVCLYIGKSTVIKATGVYKDYITRPGPFERIKCQKSIQSLFYLDDVHNVSITGPGTIDGNHLAFTIQLDEENQHLEIDTYPRPEVIYAQKCTNLKIMGIHIINSPFWTIHIMGCKNTTIEGIEIINDLHMPNTDGIDIDRSTDTMISDCNIITADDAICLKCTEETEAYGDCANVFVNNCHLTSRSAAIKFGSSSFGKFYNCHFSDINITESNRGLAFQIRDNGSTENITFSNINVHTKRFPDAWWGRGEPIYITTVPREIGDKCGTISKVKFTDIRCTTENGIFIYAKNNGDITNITFEEVSVDFENQTAYEKGEYDLRPTEEIQFVKKCLEPISVTNTETMQFNAFKVTDKDNLLSPY